jgi:PAT family beta-lactamase induction signal transducer AmpG
VLGLIATIIGALAGGALMTRLSLYGALMLFGILQAVTNLGFWFLAVTPKAYWSMASVVGLENLVWRNGNGGFRGVPDGAVPRALLGHAVCAALRAIGGRTHVSRRSAVGS